MTSISILRPLTPPSRLARSTRALHAWSEPWNVELAAPVPEKMNPNFTDLSVTPGTSLLCAPADVATSPIVATLAMAKAATARRPRVEWCFIGDVPPEIGPSNGRCRPALRTVAAT